MKKIVKQRSLEERAKFFRKNFHKAGLGSAGNPQPVKKKEPISSAHELIEEAIEKEDNPIIEEEIAVNDVVEETVETAVEDDLDLDDLDDEEEDDELDLDDDDDDLDLDDDDDDDLDLDDDDDDDDLDLDDDDDDDDLDLDDDDDDLDF